MTLHATILGAGFIGKHFIRHALELGYTLRVLDHHSCPEEFYGRMVWIQGDLNDLTLLREAIKSSNTVFHFISSTVPGDVVDESRELQQNVFLTLQLLKLCTELKVAQVLFISSASVYGIQNHMPIPETARTDPISAHGIHKLMIEKYLQLYRHQYGLDYKIIRLSNPYGPGQNIYGRQGFIAIAIGRIAADQPIMIRGNGLAIRDFIYISDVAHAIDQVAQCHASEYIYNIGSGVGYSLNQIVTMLGDLTSSSPTVEFTDARFMDIPCSVLDISLAKKHLQFGPLVSIENGLLRTLKYLNLVN